MDDKKTFKLLYVSAEVAPFAKSGGLADVAGSLPLALTEKGCEVRIAMPSYREIGVKMDYITDFPVKMDTSVETCIIRESLYQGLQVYFVDSHHYFDRDCMYCHVDDAERFAFFCRAILEMLPLIDYKPDIIHCNDWHTGPITFLLRNQYMQNNFYSKMATIFTIHNLKYQGNYSKDILRALNIDEKYFTSDKLEFYDQFSFIKTGILYSDIVNTVSETYAIEIQTPEFGELLDGILRKRSKDLYGIVNGISYKEFNPEHDPMIYENYNYKNLDVKKKNKNTLQKECGLKESDMPIIGLISRLVDQKGLDLIEEIMEDLMEINIQLVVLGIGDPYYEEMFKEMEKRYPNRVAVFIEFNEELAHKIYAGSDIFLMPSLFEPCGLGQLISLRYGTIPIVRSVGGLADTIKNFEQGKKEGNGFTFEKYNSLELLKTIERCIEVYHQKDIWGSLVKGVMKLDFSWNKQADKYKELYSKALKKMQKTH